MMKYVLWVWGTMAVAAASANNDSGKVYTYKDDNGTARQMEIYFPEGHDSAKAKVPGIIMFHGGGWGSGSRKQFQYLCSYFATRGLVAATASYQLTSEKKGKPKGPGSRKRVCIIDAKSAIRWYKQNAGKLGIDPQRIIGGGGSAGGHICLLATNNPGLNDPQDDKSVDTSVVAYLLFNPALSKGDAKDPEIDILKHVDETFPPAITFWGSEDKWLAGWNPAHAEMKKRGIKSIEFWEAEGQSHSFFNKPPWRDVTIAEADRFLRRHGLIQGEPTLPAPPQDAKIVKKP